ncbi:MAG: type VI secretion system contractile sheath large subunit, partial [Alphaproteobacteria bacterium]
MSESTQHILTRIRSPRVQITYDVEIGDAIEKKELPFVIGVLSDLAGQTQKEIPSLKERKFIEVDRDNFSDVMTALMPRLSFSVPALGGGENAQLSVELFFESINDFSPEKIVKQIPSLEKIYTSRVRLTDLVSKLDGHDGLDAELQKLLGSPELLQRLQQEALSEEGTETPEINRMIEEGQAVRDPSQMENARALLKEFILQLANAGEDFPKDSYGFILQSIKKLDSQLSQQLDEILHHPDFQKLESSWRGFHYLVTNSETGEGLKLRLLQISQKEMVRDLEKAMEFDQSQLFKKVYEEEYGTFGGNPFSCLVADFEFGRHPQEIETLRKLSNIAAAAHAPLLTAASSKLFDMESFGEIGNPRDLGKIFESTELMKWNSFRKTEDARYVALLLPHVLMRQPYGAATSPVETFDYEE